MSIEHCLKVLEAHLFSRFFLFGVLLLINISIIIIGIKKKLDEVRWEGYLLFVGLAIVFCVLVIPVIRDVQQKDFVTTQVQYYYRYPNRGSRHNFFQTSRVLVLFPGESDAETLHMPAWAKDADFPMGKYTGTITYAKRSKIILAVQTQEKLGT